MGFILGNLNQNQNAVKYFNKTLERDPNNINALINKQITLNNLKKYKKSYRMR